MSIEDLEKHLERFDVEPPVVTEPTSIGELASTRDDIGAISAQRDIEDRFNTSAVDNFDVHARASALSDPADFMARDTDPVRRTAAPPARYEKGSGYLRLRGFRSSDAGQDVSETKPWV